MRRVLMIAAATAATLAAGAASAASVEVRDAVARVTVIPENRTDIKVEVIQANIPQCNIAQLKKLYEKRGPGWKAQCC